jgi:hypothetical protein
LVQTVAKIIGKNNDEQVRSIISRFYLSYWFNLLSKSRRLRLSHLISNWCGIFPLHFKI